MFYPIERWSRGKGIGATEKNLEQISRRLRPWWTKRVKIPPEGSGPKGVRSTRLAWGAPDLATGGTDPLTGIGDPRQIRGPRKAQPREARKGLPVIPIGAGAEQRTPHTEG